MRFFIVSQFNFCWEQFAPAILRYYADIVIDNAEDMAPGKWKYFGHVNVLGKEYTKL